jgi:hypothetical protein
MVQAFNSCQFQSSVELFQGQLQSQLLNTSSHVALDQQKNANKVAFPLELYFFQPLYLGWLRSPARNKDTRFMHNATPIIFRTELKQT